MAGNLGSLILHLGADTASLQSDLGRANAIAQREAEKMRKALESVAGALGVGIGVGAFSSFIKSSIDAQDSAIKLSQKIGVPTDAIAGLSSAASKADVDVTSFQSAMVKLAKGAAEAGGGLKDQSLAYKAIGVSVKDAEGNLKSTDVLLGDLADKFASYRDGTEKTALAVKLFGKAGAEMIPLLNGGSKAIKDQIQLAKDLGASIGSDAASGAEKFNDTLADIKLAATGVGNQLATVLLPALNELATKAITFLKSAQWKEWMESVKSGTKYIADHIGDIGTALKLMGEIAATVYVANLIRNGAIWITSLATQLGGVKSLIVAQSTWGATTAASFGGAIKNVGLLGVALNIVGAAVVGWKIGEYLRDQFLEARLAGIALVDGLMTGWERIKQGAQIAWEVAKASFLVFADAASNGLSIIIKGLGYAIAQRNLSGGQALIGYAKSFEVVEDRSTKAGKAIAAINAATDANIATIHKNTGEMADYEIAGDAAAKAAKAAGGATEDLGNAAKVTAPNVANLAAQSDASAKAALAAAEAQRKFHDQVISLAADLEGPLAQAQEKYREALTNAAQAVIDGKASQDDFLVYQQLLAEQLSRTTDELAAQGDIVGQLSDEYGAKFAQVGMDKRQKAIADAVADATKKWNDNAKAMNANAQTLPQVQAAAGQLAGSFFDAEQHASALDDIISEFGQKNGFDQLIDKIKLAGDELAIVGDKSNAAFDPKRAEELRRSLDGMNKTVGKTNLSLAQDGVASLQKYAKEGTAAYKLLGIAQDILAYKSAVAAISAQGGGDPYTAFARIAAMIALMASIGITVGGGGGGASAPSAQSAEVRQASQGTGTVLGDANAKSESIAKATEITASATTTLIGINRGMLTALQSLQKALGAAGTQLARGGTSVIDAMPAITPDAGFLSSIFGGDQTIIDTGIKIAGGRLQDMLNNIVVGAYRTVETDGGWFGGTDTSTSVTDVSSTFGKQFQLVIQSISETVKQGAIALGLLPADVEAALASYQIAEINISLQGLSGEDQQKALEAVFSSIFDGIAGAVVPFIGQFQKVGEGLGETLVRVATEVQVVQEGFKQLGLSVSQTDPEKFAQIADGLIEASGGIDKFISGMQAFVQSFAPDSAQFTIASDSLNSAFEQVGLTVPSTRDGMYALMQSLDATTEAGRAQIATLLRLTDAANTYYDALDKVAKNQSDYATFIAGLNKEGEGLSTVSPFAATRLSIEKWEQDSIKQANALAKAAGLQGAAEQDLVLIHRIAARRIADAIAELMKASLDLVDKLYGGSASATADASASINSFGDAMTRVSQSAVDAVNLLLGALSPLNDQQKLETARSGLMAGTVSQDQFLEIARRLFASSQKYKDEFAFAQQYPGKGAGGDAGGLSASNAADASASVQTPDEIARQRRADANSLTQNIASLSLAQGKTYQEVAKELNLNLDSLAKDLGLSNDDLVTYLDNLKKQERAVPDSIKSGTDRIVKAIYDAAGITPPPSEGPDADTSSSASTPPSSPTASPRYAIHSEPTAVSDGRMNSYAAVASTDEPGDALRGLLAGVNDRLDSLLKANASGFDDVVEAVNDGSVATRGVGDVIERGNRDMTATIPRNTRPYAP